MAAYSPPEGNISSSDGVPDNTGSEGEVGLKLEKEFLCSLGIKRSKFDSSFERLLDLLSYKHA